ncbi:hypothetical protein [Streptomyces sp. NPDC003697]
MIAGFYAGVHWMVSHFTQQSPLEKEQSLVVQLHPGERFDRLTQIMGEEPNYSLPVGSGATVYQYDRKWESIQLITDRTKYVKAVVVYAHSGKFQPSFDVGGNKVTLNRTPIQQLSRPDSGFGHPGFVFGFCAAHAVYYFEGYPFLPNAAGGGSFAVGATHIYSGDPDVKVCMTLDKLNCPDDFQPSFTVQGDHAKCIDTPKAVQLRSEVDVSTIVLSTESELDSDMFTLPHIVARGNYD